MHKSRFIYRLIHPLILLILWSWKPLFIDTNYRTKLKLTNSITYDTGLIQVSYNVEY